MRVKLVKISRGYFNKIKVPQRFIECPPRPEKVIDKMLKFSRESELDDILIDECFYLVDGYCSYLIAKQVGLDFVNIKMIRGEEK